MFLQSNGVRLSFSARAKVWSYEQYASLIACKKSNYLKNHGANSPKNCRSVAYHVPMALLTAGCCVACSEQFPFFVDQLATWLVCLPKVHVQMEVALTTTDAIATLSRRTSPLITAGGIPHFREVRALGRSSGKLGARARIFRRKCFGIRILIFPLISWGRSVFKN